MDHRRLVVGVIRVVRAATRRAGVRADGGARGVRLYSKKRTPRQQLFRFRFQRQVKGFCTEASPNIYTLTLVNGSVWAAGTRPLWLIESLAFRRRSAEDGEDGEDGEDDKGDRLENASSSLSRSPASPIFENLIRFLTLSVYFTPLLLLSVPCMVFGVHRALWVRMLRLTLSVSGPAFIKWGQWAATRHDMFPIDVCLELQTLHADAPSHSLKHTDREIEESFGFRREDLFDRFEEVPVASGSIGQIYRCELSGVGSRLTGTAAGTVVAVKVRHPGVIEVIQRDFELITAIVDGLERVFRGVDGLRLLKESLSQFSLPLREQVDLSREGKYLGIFAENFRGEKRVNFPAPLFPLVSPSVLVETFEAGEHISRYVEGRGRFGKVHNTELARIGARAMLHMLIVDNLVHADLHPGNILVDFKPRFGVLGAWLAETSGWFSEDAVNRYLLAPSVVLIDAGMVTRLSRRDQVNMVGLFDSFSRLDGEDMAGWTLAFAGDEQTCTDPEAFRRDVKAAFDAFRQRDVFDKGNTDNGAEVLAGLLEKVRVHHVSLPGHIVGTVVTTLVLEGWSHQLDPAHSTLREVRRLIHHKHNATKLRDAATWIESVVLNEREILGKFDAHWERVIHQSPGFHYIRTTERG